MSDLFNIDKNERQGDRGGGEQEQPGQGERGQECRRWPEGREERECRQSVRKVKQEENNYWDFLNSIQHGSEEAISNYYFVYRILHVKILGFRKIAFEDP